MLHRIDERERKKKKKIRRERKILSGSPFSKEFYIRNRYRNFNFKVLFHIAGLISISRRFQNTKVKQNSPQENNDLNHNNVSLHR